MHPSHPPHSRQRHRRGDPHWKSPPSRSNKARLPLRPALPRPKNYFQSFPPGRPRRVAAIAIGPCQSQGLMAGASLTSSASFALNHESSTQRSDSACFASLKALQRSCRIVSNGSPVQKHSAVISAQTFEILAPSLHSNLSMSCHKLQVNL